MTLETKDEKTRAERLLDRAKEDPASAACFAPDPPDQVIIENS